MLQGPLADLLIVVLMRASGGHGVRVPCRDIVAVKLGSQRPQFGDLFPAGFTESFQKLQDRVAEGRLPDGI